jgi:glycosyltransferase involved in cell wall biosynthesis
MAEPQRLTLVISSVGMGGAERVLSLLANRWADQGRSVALLTFDDGSEPPFFELRPSIDLQPLALSGRSAHWAGGVVRNAVRMRLLRRALAQSRPETIISFMDQVNVLTLLASRGLRVPVVISERTDPAVHKVGRSWNAARRLTYSFADAIVVQTDSIKKRFEPFMGSKIHVIPNPAPAPPASPAAHEAERTIISMGRLIDSKGFDLLIEAFAKISAARPGWRLEIIGEGPERGRLEDLVHRLGVVDRVFLPGLSRIPMERFRAAQVFALSSHYEGFPNVLLEAMACGLAVVSADCPTGPRHIVRDGVDGLLVPAGNAGALAAALDRLTGDPALRRALGREALAVTRRFSLEEIGRQWDGLLARLGEKP